MFGSTRTEFVTSVVSCINATDAVESLLKKIVFRPRTALTHALRRRQIAILILAFCFRTVPHGAALRRGQYIPGPQQAW